MLTGGFIEEERGQRFGSIDVEFCLYAAFCCEWSGLSSTPYSNCSNLVRHFSYLNF